MFADLDDLLTAVLADLAQDIVFVSDPAGTPVTIAASGIIDQPGSVDAQGLDHWKTGDHRIFLSRASLDGVRPVEGDQVMHPDTGAKLVIQSVQTDAFAGAYICNAR